MRPMGARVLKFDSAVGVHSEHDLKEQSDAQIIVSRFPFRGEGCGIDAFGVDEYSRLSAAALRNCLPALTVILSASEESRCMTGMRQTVVNTSRREDSGKGS